MYQRMLVPLDGSEMAEKVLPYAAQLARRLHLETALLHVCSPAESASLFMCRSYIEHIAELVASQLRGSESQTGPSKPPVITAKTISGEVAPSILGYADDIRADLILMSRHGHSGIGRWLMGSIAHKVLTAARVPVMIIHPNHVPDSPLSQWPRSALVLMDGSKMSEEVVDHIESLFQKGRFDSNVTLFEVCEPPDLLADYPEAIMPLTWQQHVERAKSASERVCSTYLGGIKERLAAKGIEARVDVGLGDNVIDEIIRYTREHSPDLIVMTTHGHSGATSWPYGHVADRVLQSVFTPLFLIRPREATK
jgi:nucleotide-binding universal stress UspA family protein